MTQPSAIVHARGTAMLRSALGPAIAAWLDDANVAEIMLNADGRLWVDHLDNGIAATEERLSPLQAERIIRLVAHHVGAEVHRATPRVSAELPEGGERFEGLLPPVVVEPVFSIRRPASLPLALADYVAAGTMTATAAAYLAQAVQTRANILVAGGTSTGKTTLTNALLGVASGGSDRIILIEDTRELRCDAANVVALRTAPGVTMTDLVRSSLRLRPDRIPVGEVRGPEALDLLKAWGTGHPGGIGTIHAGTATAALHRLEQLILEAIAHVPRALISDFLPWAAMIAPGIVLNKDGSFLRVARFRGPDLDSATQAELIATSARLNSALKRLGTGWAIYVEAQRKASPGYPLSAGFADPVSALIDEERRDLFDGGDITQPNFTSAYYLTLQWLPPADDTSRASALFYEGGAEGVATAADHLDDFEREAGRVLDMIEGVMPEASWLSSSDTLTYLHSTISTHDQKVAVPETPMHLDALLADELLVGGLAPQLGSKHLRCLSITGFPASTVPGMLDELNRLGFAYRWTTRAISLDKVSAQRMLTRIRRLWFSKRKSLAAIIKEVLTNEASVLVDNDAANKSAEADAALQDLGADIAGYAYVTTTITVLGNTPREADIRLAGVEKIIRGRDFACIAEGLNALEAWLGSLPGNPYANVRQPPISTLNLAHIMPVSAVWAGPDQDAHFKGPPLFHARTQGSTPFRFSLHVGDVGHTLVVGPTGSGKSVLLAFMALQFRRYRQAQIFAFDHGGSIRAGVLGVGGEWHDLGGALGGDAGPVSLQPLARIDEPHERAWAADWLGAILAREGFAITPEVKDHLWTALGSLADAPVAQRTLTGLTVLIQASGLKRALAPYTLAGPYGRLLDGDVEHFGESDAQAFETEGLVGTPAAPAVLGYLFHRIGRRLDGQPTLILIDEGWLALDDPLFGRQLKEWLKTLRKKNASVVFATQSLADIEGSAIAPAIIESCPTRLFLANERALEPQILSVYRRFGLNDRQIEIIASATPKRDYYCQSALGNRLFDLGLGPVALAFAAASSRSDLNAISALIEREGTENFAAAWLRHRGLGWAADLLAAPASPFTPAQEEALP